MACCVRVSCVPVLFPKCGVRSTASRSVPSPRRDHSLASETPPKPGAGSFRPPGAAWWLWKAHRNLELRSCVGVFRRCRAAQLAFLDRAPARSQYRGSERGGGAADSRWAPARAASEEEDVLACVAAPRSATDGPTSAACRPGPAGWFGSDASHQVHVNEPLTRNL